MLIIELPEREYFNESEGVFYNLQKKVLRFEHSLRSLYDWESKWRTPFLSVKEFTTDQIASYLHCMSLEPIEDRDILRMTEEHYSQVSDYLEDPMTATTFPETNERPSREKITAELIYYWMITAGLPLECETWHLNRLFTLIRVVNVKNAPPKKMSQSDIARRNRELNERRKQELGTRG